VTTTSVPGLSGVVNVIARNWWALLIRGIVAIIFGILAFIWPGATILAIGILFGAYAFVDGIFAIVATVRAAEAGERWWPFLIEGIVGILIAAITFYDIRITLLALYLTIAAWAFITGIFEIVAAIQLRKAIANEFWLILGGIASIAFGVLMVIFPLIGALALIWLIGSYAIIFGIIMVAFSFRLRAHIQSPPPAAATTT
jgi:uncharacterized membrane protein HdeD (DUF308 family)